MFSFDLPAYPTCIFFLSFISALEVATVVVVVAVAVVDKGPVSITGLGDSGSSLRHYSRRQPEVM